MKIKYSKVYDPETWDFEGFQCATPEDAEKAMELISNLVAESDIDRAMQWCEEYLRDEEIYNDRWKLCMGDVIDYCVDTCVRYLEKVEEGL